MNSPAEKCTFMKGKIIINKDGFIRGPAVIVDGTIYYGQDYVDGKIELKQTQLTEEEWDAIKRDANFPEPFKTSL